MTYPLETLEADTIVLVGRNARATSTDTIPVRPSGSGSEKQLTKVLSSL